MSVKKELETYKQQRANVLGPITNMESLSEFHRVVIDSVLLSPNPDDGDVYKYKDASVKKPAQFILTGQALQKLAVCAGVFWSSTETRATTQSQKYVAYNAVGCIRKTDGTPVCFQAEYDIDIDVVEDELREQFSEKKKRWIDQDWFKKLGADGQNNYIETAFQKELNFKKKHKTKLAATGAKIRVIRALLGIKKTYTQQELSKPFVMLRVVLQPDYSDPEIKRIMLTSAIQALTGVYGHNNQFQSPIYNMTEETSDYTDGEQTQIINIDEGNNVPVEEEKNDTKPPSGQEIFEDLSATEQVEALKQLCSQKGYDPKQPVKYLSESDRVKFFSALQELPDIKK